MMKNPTSSDQIEERNRYELYIALVVFLSCLAIIAVDKDTHSWSDFFYPANILALLIYFTPTFILSCMLYRLFAKKNVSAKSFLFSLLIGVPVGFTLIILFFVLVLS
jgi:hypothetical protein